MNPAGSRWYWFVRNFVRRFVFGALGGMRVLHEDRVPAEGPIILAPNHVSTLDPPIVACASPRTLAFMAKEELFRPPVFGPLIRSLNAFPLKRGKGDIEAVKMALRLLEARYALLIFPEGTRGPGEVMLPFESGVYALARKTGAPVVPVGVCGTARVLPKGSKMPRRGRMTVAFGRPMLAADYGAGEEAKRAFLADLEAQIVELTTEGGDPIKAAPARLDQTASIAPETASARSHPESV